MTHQEALLRAALAERGRDGASVVVDHLNGSALVDGSAVGLVYPDSFFAATEALFRRTERPVSYFFRGYLPPRGGRIEMLARWREVAGASISESNWAQAGENKGAFDSEYFSALGAARFGLCPNHTHWPGPPETAWSYRFVDCCLVGALPVLFRTAPLSARFVDGFEFVWDDESGHRHTRGAVEHNRARAEKVFFL